MTEDEINLKIAAILGWAFVPAEEGHYGKMTYPKWRHPGGHEYVSETPPPYTTDWTWCGPLVEKYGISLLTDGATEWRAVSTRRPNTQRKRDVWGTYESTPQRAICLAVIAAQPIPATLPPEAPIHDNDHS